MTEEKAQQIADELDVTSDNAVDYLSEFKDISEWTKDDFLNSSKPYEFCVFYADRKFEYEQLKQKMSEQAKSVGVKNFSTLLSLYCKKNGIDTEQSSVTNFPNQPLELMCGGYSCDVKGVYQDNELICPHPLLITARMCNIDTGIEKIKLAYSRGRGWRSIVVDRKTIATASKIVDLSDFGIAVTSETAKSLVKYLAKLEQLNPELLPETECVTRCGWIKDEDDNEGLMFSPYLENIVFDGESEYKKHYESVKQSKGKLETWLDMIRTNIRENNTPARMVFASSLASVLVKPLGCNCFWVHLWGETESAKTVLAMTAASIWGNPEVGSFISTFNSTAVGMEKTAAFYNNLPYIVDELQIVNDKKDMDNLIYMLTEGSGRSRGNKFGGLDAIPKWKNAVITTGERPIATVHSGGGAVNRVIEIECKSKFFSDPRFVANTCKANYGEFGRMFIRFLRMNGTLEKLEEMFDGYQKKLISEYGIMQKQAQSAALLLTADELITNMIFDDGRNLTCEEVLPYLKTKDDVSVNPRAYEFVCEWVAVNQMKFTLDPDKTRELYGKLTDDGDAVYIVCSRFKQICDEGNYNSQALLSYLRDNKLVEMHNGKSAVAQRIGSVVSKCIKMKLPNQNGVENTSLVDLDDF